MASSSNTLVNKTLSTKEVLTGIFADNDSEYEVDSDSEYSESSSEVSIEEEIVEEVIEVPRKRCKTRGGKTVTPS